MWHVYLLLHGTGRRDQGKGPGRDGRRHIRQVKVLENVGDEDIGSVQVPV
jgi:hypothetical protein